MTNDDEMSGEELVALLSEGLGRRLRALRVAEPLALGTAARADLFRGLTGSRLPGLRAAVRFLQGGNPYTSAAARETLGWNPAVRHRVALPRAVREVTGEP